MKAEEQKKLKDYLSKQSHEDLVNVLVECLDELEMGESIRFHADEESLYWTNSGDELFEE